MSMEIDFQKMMSRAPRVRLDTIIEEAYHPNSNDEYGVDDVRGVANTKGFIFTKANLDGRNLKKFNQIRPHYFAFNRRTTRNGERIGLGYNETSNTYICTEDYVVFRVKEEYSDMVLPYFLFLALNRSEFDRYVRYDSWGSATEFFNWENMQRVEITLPTIEIQREIVATYEGLKKIAEDNEALLEPLQAACHAYIVDCKAKYPEVPLGLYIEQTDERNRDKGLTVESVRGISNLKEIIPTKAEMTGVSLDPYKVLNPKEFCFVTVTSRNGGKISISMNNNATPYIFSSSYITFRTTDVKVLMPDFLYLLFNRAEFDRYSRFNSWGSARETFDWNEMQRFRIPLPPIEVQEAIVSIYHCMEEAKSIAREARELMKTICPALIQKAANSGGCR